MPTRIRASRSCLAGIVLGSLLMLAVAADAAWTEVSDASEVTGAVVFTVNSTVDGADLDPGDGVCEWLAGSGSCSLRAAVMEANTVTSGTVRIELPSDEFVLVQSAPDDDSRGDLDLHSAAAIEITAESPGASIDANGNNRALDVQAGRVSLAGVAVRGAGSAGVDIGSGVFISLHSSTIHDNIGPGVRIAAGASTEMDNTTVSGNGEAGMLVDGHLAASYSTIAANAGGGLAGSGTAAVAASVVVDQTAGQDCSIDLESGGDNTDSDGSCGFGQGSDSTDPHPGLFPLGYGLVPAHVPQAGSTLVDSVELAACGTGAGQLDGRGIPRPIGAGCDRGAAEMSAEEALGPFVAVGTYGTRAWTSGDGRIWHEAATPLDGDARDVAADGSGLWVAVGADGSRVWRSLDGGVHWSSAADAPSQELHAVATDGSGTWVAAGLQSMWRSTDGGDTWMQSPTPIGARMVEVATDGQGRWTAVGALPGGVRWAAYSDDGWTWREANTHPGGQVMDIATDGKGNWVAVGQAYGGGVWTSADGGQNWTGATIPSPWFDFGAVATDGAGNWVTAESNHVSRSSDAGMSWSPVDWVLGSQRAVTTDGDGLWAAVGFYSGAASTDAGITWAHAPEPPYGLAVAVASNERLPIPLCGPARPGPFPDVSGEGEFCEHITWLAARGVTDGYEGGEFRPSAPISRQAMAAFLYRLAGAPDGPFPDPGFADVPAGHGFADEIWWLASTGITGGYVDGTFRPTAGLSRQAMAAFLYRYEGSPAGPFGDPSFLDVPATHGFADAIWWLASTGITNGYQDGTYRPTAPLSRQAMAAFLHRLNGL